MELDTGETAVIKRVDGGRILQKRLASLGIRVGISIRKVTSEPFNGPIVVEVDRAKVAIGRGMAVKVFVGER